MATDDEIARDLVIAVLERDYVLLKKNDADGREVMDGTKTGQAIAELYNAVFEKLKTTRR